MKGHIRTRRYDDPKPGSPHGATEVVAENIAMPPDGNEDLVEREEGP